MKKRKEISVGYTDYLHGNVQNPQPRLSALKQVAKFIKSKYPEILNGEITLGQVDKNELKDRYVEFKGKKINGAEHQVFNDFYVLGALKYNL